jgi:hypothetical protein
MVRALTVSALLLLLVLPEGTAQAIPKDPPPDEPLLAQGIGQGDEKPTLVARRRRRRRPRRRPKRRPPARAKPAPKPADPGPAAASDLADPGDPSALRRGGRVEFDGRLVQGQTAKSGAIYLFARKRTELRSMVHERAHYRKQIMRTVYSNWKTKEKK